MSAPTPRYHALDSLRAAAMLLGIFFHASLAYVDPPQSYWVVQDASRHLAFGVFAWASHSFRMQVFFVMAGFFARLLYGRYGPRRFATHRGLRIALPFGVGVLLDNALQQSAFHYAYATGLFVPDAPEMAAAAAEPLVLASYLRQFRLGIYWFLEYLLVFSVCVLLFGSVAKRFDARAFGQRLEHAFRWLIDRPWKAFALAIPHALLLLPAGEWGVGSPRSIAPELLWLLYYGIFFAVGWAFQRAPSLLERLERGFRRDLLLAVFVAALALGSAVAGTRGLIPPGARIVVLWLTASFSWLMVFGLMGAFLRVFRSERPAIRYVSDSSYWLYLTHDYYVMGLQIALASLALGSLFKYALVVGGGLACLFTTYELCVRYTWVGAVLNGRKTRGPRLGAAASSPAPAPDAPPSGRRAGTG